ncbi:hypothetical protein MMC34_003589 [Xylographa carneopallida]|nr:hypothetical protein [Xylographa carneopallida]
MDDGDLSFTAPTAVHLEPLVYPAKSKHTHTFIFLYGRGDTARNFGPQFLNAEHSSGQALRDLLPGVKFIFPTAKRRRMAASNRCTISQWFDIVSLTDPAQREEVQIQGLRESSTLIHRIITQEMASIPRGNVILGGLSQGCATVLYALLTFDDAARGDGAARSAVGAVVGMSGWLPFRSQIAEIMKESEDGDLGEDPFDRGDEPCSATTPSKEMQAVNFLRENVDLRALPAAETSAALRTPVFLGHGSADLTVDVALGEGAASTLEALGMDVRWVPYRDFYHWYKEPEEIDDVVAFLQEKVDLEGRMDGVRQ